MRSLIFILLAVSSLPLVAQAPADLQLFDDTLGGVASPQNDFRIRPNHLHRLRAIGSPSDQVLLGLSAVPGNSSVTFNNIAVLIDLPTATFFYDGFASPGLPRVNAQGFLDIPFSVPDQAPMGTSIFVQGIVGSSATPLITPGYSVRFSGEPMSYLGNGEQSNHPQAPSAALLTITTQAQYQLFWTAHDTTSTPTPPAVNFNTQIVLVKYAGDFPSTGVSISIDDAYLDLNGVMQVYMTQLSAGPPPLPTPTRPWYMVQVNAAAFSQTVNETINFVALP